MAREVMAIRVDNRTRARLAAAARREGRTPSDVVRLALDAWLEGRDRRAAQMPYEGMADLIGRVKGGGAVAGRQAARRRR